MLRARLLTGEVRFRDVRSSSDASRDSFPLQMNRLAAMELPASSWALRQMQRTNVRSQIPAELRKVAPIPERLDRRALVVLGMHRSGTSAMTRMLSLLGASLPKHLMA